MGCEISRHIKVYGNLRYGENVRIDDGCIFTGDVVLGNYVHIGPYCVFIGGAGIKVGDFSGFSGGCYVYTATDDYSGEYLWGPTVPERCRNVKKVRLEVGRYVLVGARSTIMCVPCIPDGVALGAHSLLLEEPERWTVYVGAPARAVKLRRFDCARLSEGL